MNRFSLFIFFLICFSSCENSKENISNFISSEELPVEELTHSEIIYTENGMLKVKIMSNKMERYVNDEDRVELFDGVHFDFYRLDIENQKSVLTSEIAIINNTTNIMKAIQNVILESSDNKKLLTEELIWDKSKGLIYTDLEVVIRTEDEIISGIGFKSTPDFTEYEIKEAKGTFSINK